MAETKKTYQIYINQDSSKITTATGSKVAVSLPELFLGNTFVFQAFVINSDLSSFAFPADAVFFASLNTTLGQGKADAAASTHAQFNLADHWPDQLSLPGGRISWEMNTSTADLQTFLGTRTSDNIFLELWFKVPGGDFSLIMQQKLKIYNTGSDFEPVAVEGLEYALAAELLPLAAPQEVAAFSNLPQSPKAGQTVLVASFGQNLTWSALQSAWLNPLGTAVTAADEGDA